MTDTPSKPSKPAAKPLEVTVKPGRKVEPRTVKLWTTVRKETNPDAAAS